MILEVATIEVLAENKDAFESAIKRGVSEVLSKADGFVDYRLNKGIERIDTYALHIRWETLEAHTVGFRQSDLFPQWRGIIGGFFAKPPVVEHWLLDGD